MDCSPLGSSVHGISQARILELVSIWDPRIEPMAPAVAGGFFTTEPPGKSVCVCTYTHTHKNIQNHSFILWLYLTACSIWVPWLGIETLLPEVEAGSSNYWTAKEFFKITVDGNVNWYSYYEEQYGGSLKKYKTTLDWDFNTQIPLFGSKLLNKTEQLKFICLADNFLKTDFVIPYAFQKAQIYPKLIKKCVLNVFIP